MASRGFLTRPSFNDPSRFRLFFFFPSSSFTSAHPQTMLPRMDRKGMRQKRRRIKVSEGIVYFREFGKMEHLKMCKPIWIKEGLRNNQDQLLSPSLLFCLVSNETRIKRAPNQRIAPALWCCLQTLNKQSARWRIINDKLNTDRPSIDASCAALYTLSAKQGTPCMLMYTEHKLFITQFSLSLLCTKTSRHFSNIFFRKDHGVPPRSVQFV